MRLKARSMPPRPEGCSGAAVTGHLIPKGRDFEGLGGVKKVDAVITEGEDFLSKVGEGDVGEGPVGNGVLHGCHESEGRRKREWLFISWRANQGNFSPE